MQATVKAWRLAEGLGQQHYYACKLLWYARPHVTWAAGLHPKAQPIFCCHTLCASVRTVDDTLTCPRHSHPPPLVCSPCRLDLAVLMHAITSSLLLPPPSASCSLRVSLLFLHMPQCRQHRCNGQHIDQAHTCAAPPTAHQPPVSLFTCNTSAYMYMTRCCRMPCAHMQHFRMAKTGHVKGVLAVMATPVGSYTLLFVDLLNHRLEVTEAFVDDTRLLLAHAVCPAALNVFTASQVDQV